MNRIFNPQCRLCMQVCVSPDSIELFPTNGTSSANAEAIALMLKAIKSCYNIRVEANDELPTRICKNCAQCLELFYSSQMMVSCVNRVLNNSILVNKVFTPLTSKRKKSSWVEECIVVKNIGTTIDKSNILPPDNRREKKPHIEMETPKICPATLKKKLKTQLDVQGLEKVIKPFGSGKRGRPRNTPVTMVKEELVDGTIVSPQPSKRTEVESTNKYAARYKQNLKNQMIIRKMEKDAIRKRGRPRLIKIDVATLDKTEGSANVCPQLVNKTENTENRPLSTIAKFFALPETDLTLTELPASNAKNPIQEDCSDTSAENSVDVESIGERFVQDNIETGMPNDDGNDDRRGSRARKIRPVSRLDI